MKTLIKKRNVWDAYLIVFITVAFGFSLNYSGTDFFCVLTFFINGITSIVFMLLALRRSGVSTELVYWIFMYFFMFFAPLIQYTKGNFPWIYTSFSHNVIVTANITILVWNVIFAVITNILRVRKKYDVPIKQNDDDDELDNASAVSPVLCNVITAISFLIAIAYFASNGLSVFGASRTSGALLFSSDESSITMLLNKCMTALIHGTVVYTWFYMKQTGRRLNFVISIICLLICLFPTRLARYLAAVVYGGLILTFFKFVRRRSTFLWGFTAMFLIAFPLLGVFRRLTLSEVDLLKTVEGLFTNFFDTYTEGNYDAYAMLCSVVRYIILHGVTFGWQLLGCLLFFVPRAFWPTKPIGSGITVANYLGYPFDNVSCPLPAEFLINFGYVGVIFGAAATGVLINYIDTTYRSGKYGMFFRTMYPIVVMFIFFVLRGDLLSSFSYFMAYFFVFFLLSYINGKLTSVRAGRSAVRAG